MQEAMDMTPEEFDAAAHQLLASEQDIGALRLPIGMPMPGGRGPVPLVPDPSWGDEEDESSPLNPLQGAPERYVVGSFVKC